MKANLESGLTAIVRELAREAKRGSRDGILPSEEYFTERLVVRLKDLPRVRVYSVPGYQEALKGCDIELWLWLNKSGFWNISLQAKRQYKSGRYEHLGYKQGRQLEDLESYSRSMGSVPAYLLYTHETASLPWHCSCPSDQVLLGVSLVPSWRVRMALERRGARKPNFLHEPRASISLRCILHMRSAFPNSLRIRAREEGALTGDEQWPGFDAQIQSWFDTNLFVDPEARRPKYVAVMGHPDYTEGHLDELFHRDR